MMACQLNFRNTNICLLLLISLLNLPSEVNNLSNSNDIADLIAATEDFLVKNTNVSIIQAPEAKACSNVIKNSLSNRTLLYTIINYSGKGISDIGLEDECLQYGLAYLLFTIEVNLDSFLKDSENYFVYRFLNQKTFFFGVCAWKPCEAYAKIFFNRTINEEFYAYLFESHGITKMEIFVSQDKDSFSSQLQGKDRSYTVFLIVMHVFFIYVVAKVLISIVGFSYYTSSVIMKRTNSSDGTTDESGDGDDDDDDFSIQRKSLAVAVVLSSHDHTKQIETFVKEPKPTTYRVYKFFSLIPNLRIIFKKRGAIYNETGIELLAFIRMLIIFLVTYSHNMAALIHVPIRDITNPEFYPSFWFITVKFAICATDCWVTLDGIIVGYKLMSYLKQHVYMTNSMNFSILIFLKFYMSVIPKMAVFFFLFFVLNVNGEYFVHLIGANPMFQYYIRSDINCRECQINPTMVFHPLFPYQDFNEGQRGFEKCFRFVYIYINELYSLTFVLILFYLAYKIRRKGFDIVVLVIFTVNFLLSIFTSEKFLGESYTLAKFFGENSALKYTHLFLNTYMIGIFTGLAYFYYFDVISSNPIANQLDYAPFYFCHTFISFIDRVSEYKKKLYVAITILLQIVISMSFYIYIQIYPDKEDPDDMLSFKIDWVINIIDIYEKKVFVTLFNFLIILLILYPKDTTLKHLIGSNVFTWINRISFAYFCSMNTLIYMSYTIFHFQIELTFQNLFFMTVGLMAIVLIACLFIVLFIELPCRILLKKCQRYFEKR